MGVTKGLISLNRHTPFGEDVTEVPVITCFPGLYHQKAPVTSPHDWIGSYFSLREIELDPLTGKGAAVFREMVHVQVPVVCAELLVSVGHRSVFQYCQGGPAKCVQLIKPTVRRDEFDCFLPIRTDL